MLHAERFLNGAMETDDSRLALRFGRVRDTIIIWCLNWRFIEPAAYFRLHMGLQIWFGNPKTAVRVLAKGTGTLAIPAR